VEDVRARAGTWFAECSARRRFGVRELPGVEKRVRGEVVGRHGKLVGVSFHGRSDTVRDKSDLVPLEHDRELVMGRIGAAFSEAFAAFLAAILAEFKFKGGSHY